MRGRRQPRERARNGREAVAKEFVRTVSRGGGGAEVERHEAQHDHTEGNEQDGDGGGVPEILRALPALVGAAVPVLLARGAEKAFVAICTRSVAMTCAALAGGPAPRARDRHHGLPFQVDVRVVGRTRHGQDVALTRYVAPIEGEAGVKAVGPKVAFRHVDELWVVAHDGDAILVAVAEDAVCLAAPRLHLGIGIAPDAIAPL